MRKNVTAITAQAPAMWKDDDQGEPDASTISPKAVRNTPNAANLAPLRRGFSFSCGIGAAVISTCGACLHPRPID
jgi:hypothetical protein